MLPRCQTVREMPLQIQEWSPPPQFGSDLSSRLRTGTLLSTASIDAIRERVNYRDSTPDPPKAFGRVDVSTQTP